MSYRTQGERMAAKIKREKLKMSRVAEIIGTSPQNIRCWTKGFCVPSMKFSDTIEAWLRGGK